MLRQVTCDEDPPLTHDGRVWKNDVRKLICDGGTVLEMQNGETRDFFKIRSCPYEERLCVDARDDVVLITLLSNLQNKVFAFRNRQQFATFDIPYTASYAKLRPTHPTFLVVEFFNNGLIEYSEDTGQRLRRLVDCTRPVCTMEFIPNLFIVCYGRNKLKLKVFDEKGDVVEDIHHPKIKGGGFIFKRLDHMTIKAIHRRPFKQSVFKLVPWFCSVKCSFVKACL